MGHIIVYHKVFKLGIVEPRQNSNKLLSIRFIDGVHTINNTTGIENNPFLITLSDEFENYIINAKYKNDFDRLTKERASKLQFDLSSVEITASNEINAKVTSSSFDTQYKVEIKYANNALLGDCACPVGFDCKHIYRVLDKIHSFYVSNYNSPALDIYNQVKKVSGYRSPTFLFLSFISFNELKKYFDNKLTDDFIKPLLETTHLKADINSFNIIYLYLNIHKKDSLNNYLDSIPANTAIKKFYEANIKEATNYKFVINKLEKDNFYSLVNDLFEGNYDALLEFALYNKDYKYYDFTSGLNSLIPLCHLTKEDISTITNLIVNNNAFSKETVDAIKPLLNAEQMLTIYRAKPYLIDLDYSVIDYEDGLEYFSQFNDNERLKFIKANINKLEENARYYIEQLFELVNERYNFSYDCNLYDCLCEFQDASYYALLFLNVSNNKTFINMHINDAIERTKHIDLSKLDEYFKFDVINHNEDIYNDEYFLRVSEPSFNFSNCIYINDVDKFVYYYWDNLVCNCLNDKNRTIKNYFDELNKICKAATTEKLNSIIDATFDKCNNAKKKIVQDEMRTFLLGQSKNKTNKIALKILNEEKTRLKIELNTNSSLNVYIGKQKLYKIHYVADFIHAVRNEENIDVYKNYKFNCSLEEFDDFSKELTNILLTCFLANSYESNYFSRFNNIYLNEEGLARLIHLYNGIYREKVFYSLNKEEKEVKFSIDENKVITMSSTFEREDLIFAKDGVYYIDRLNKTLSLIKGGDQINSILDFFLSFEGYDIEKNEEFFLKYIYKGNEELISIPESINKLNENYQNIEIYIDMEENVLTKKIVVKENGLPIEKNEYSTITIENLNFIDNLFKNFKFIDNKIVKDEDIYNFLIADISPLQSICTIYLSEHIKTKNIINFPKQNLRIDYGSSMIEAFWTESSFSNEELEKIYNALKKKKKFVQLKNNQIINIQNENAKEFYNISEGLRLDKTKLTTEQKTNFYNAFKAINAIEDNKVKEYFTKVIDEVKDFKNNKLDLSNINAKLRDYQIDGVNWMASLAKHNLGGILADDMGLGKTLQTIALLNIDKTAIPSLIVCPKSLVFNWYNEFLKFDPNTKAIKIFGSQEERKQIINNIKPNEHIIYITSYDSLRNDLEKYNCTFQYLILDEAQAIKTFTSKKSRSVKQIKSIHRFALTGTPIENSALELWSIFDFLMPGYLDDIDVFKKRFETEDEYKNIIAKRVSLFILRRTKKDVLNDLPEKIERVIEAEMTTEQRKTYDAYCQVAKKALGQSSSIFEILPYLMRLRQICVEPSMFIENYSGNSGKMNLIYDYINTLIKEGHKVLIFSQFVKALNILETHLNKEKIKYYLLTGETKAEERVILCDKFNNDKTPLFLISLKAGGNGLNLTGADTVIHIDPWWNAAVQDQATDRAHRIGQKNNVTVLKFICENSIEEKVIELQNMKKDLIDSLISSNEKSILQLTHDDIKFLLN